MTIEELNLFLEKNRENYSIQLKRMHPDFYRDIDGMYDFESFGQKLYHFLNGENVGRCESCGKKCKFDGIYKGYRNRCSYKCVGDSKHKNSHETRNCVVCNKEFDVYKKRKKITCSKGCLLTLNSSKDVNEKRMNTLRNTMLKKYGVDHASKLSDFVFKSKKTKLEKYGDENYVNINKVKNTKIDKYGDENYVNIDKVKKTKLEKYGDENYNNRPKARTTLIDKYGLPYSPNVSISTKKNLESGKIGFGTDGFLKTMRDRYGVENAMKNSDVSRRSKNEKNKKYLERLFKKIEDKFVPMFSESEYLRNKVGGVGIPYKFKCKKCNDVFSDIISNGKDPRCLSCEPYPTKSGIQLELVDFIKSKLGNECLVVKDDRTVINPLELDVYIPEKKLAIELDGIYWHGESCGKDKNYHLNKTEKCEVAGVRLIHIFENEWMNNQDIVKRRLTHILGLNNAEKIYARDCEVRVVGSNVASRFLTLNHLQGPDKSSIKLGLFYNDKLVSVMTFGNKRVALGNSSNIADDEYELYRFCMSQTVIGAAGRMFSYFVKNYNPESVISYADRRYSKSGEAFYKKLGFDLSSVTSPNYWYFYKSNALKLYHRFNFRKNVLKDKLKIFDENLSEWENMKNNGYDRIWDCGHLKYEWKK